MSPFAHLAYLRALYEETPVMMHAIDAEGRIEMVSNLWLAALGYTREEVLGRPSTDFLTEESARYAREVILPDFFVTGVCTDVPYQFVTKSGQTRDIRLSATAERDEEGRFVRSRAVLIDVTERVAAERERERLQAQMLHTQKLESLGVLAGGIAHDFNNLLVGIMGNADLLLADLPADAPVRPFAQDILLTAHRAADLCRQLLAYSGRGQLSFGPVDLEALVHEMSQILDVSISKRAALELRPAPSPVVVDGDATQLRQVLLNLIMNSAEAMSSQRGHITVHVGWRAIDRSFLDACLMGETVEPGTYAVLEVSDDGSGMDAETRERLFDPFFSTKFAGRGLGLAAVLGIVRSHHGALHLQSEPGVGTTIEILFPRSRAAALAPDPVPGAAPFRGEGTALVIDDEPSVRSMARRMLERLGYSVREAQGGHEGLELVRAQPLAFSLVVLDMTMPKLGGAEILPELRRMAPELPVLLTSGYSEAGAAQSVASAPRTRFLEKPFSFERFTNALQQLFAPRAG